MCHFQEDNCNWAIQSDNAFKWERYNAQNLENEGIPGPMGDLNDAKDKNFMIASEAKAGDVAAGSKTWLRSANFKVKEHPLECLSFFFQFGVICSIK